MEEYISFNEIIKRIERKHGIEICDENHSGSKNILTRRRLQDIFKTWLRKQNVDKSEFKKIIGRGNPIDYPKNLVDKFLFDNFDYFVAKKDTDVKTNEEYRAIIEQEEEKRHNASDEMTYMDEFQREIDEREEETQKIIENEFSLMKREIMLQAIFSKYFMLDEEKLRDDLTNRAYFKMFNIELDEKIARSMDDLKKLNNYYNEKQ
ncbi:hypothetical protein [Sporolactobacillus putidus]|uniref:Uncharacterized protein n=1 Tax=Sporolactobacillus putidus TaxID=492735 RepID=A0A917S9P7_9BACL|nr:hypothetical protein [Sporolactobacillus putidus]GGL63017.1 hypothetical protein GCM10007968_28690 [Sporolactobacillus putidus]